MTWRVVTIEPDADLVRAGLLMFEQRIGSLPVIEVALSALRTGIERRDPAELYLG